MKHYTKPVVISQKSFETSALGCLKNAPGEDTHLSSGSTYITGTGDIGTGTFHINPGFASTSLPCSYLLNVS